MRTNEYRLFIKKKLNQECFKPNQSRINYVALVLAIAFLCIVLIKNENLGLFFKCALAIVLGLAFALMAFLGHEVSHGSVTTSRYLRPILEFVLGIPLIISPSLWKYWHNGLHHRFTEVFGIDPDALLTDSEFKRRRWYFYLYLLSPGSQKLISYLFFPLIFLVHKWKIFIFDLFMNPVFKKADKTKITLETIFQSFIWVLVLRGEQVEQVLLILVLPTCLASLVMTSFIITNHSVSMATEDPLEHSLSLKSTFLQSTIFLNFGLHTEHHIFPELSGAHLPEVRAILIEYFPEKYKSKSHYQALRDVFRFPKVRSGDHQYLHPL